jgi:nitrogen PTS system EIIA component
MDLNEFFGPKAIVVNLRGENRWEAIDELVDHLVVHQKIKPGDKVAIGDAVKKRERSTTTGVGFEIAIPHASTDLVSEVIGIVGLSRQGVQFDALDLKPVKIVLLFLVPQGQFQKHLHTLANIAKLLHRRDFRDWLRGFD